MIKQISSRDNKYIKHISKLSTKKYRQDAAQFVIEGRRIFDHAIKFGADIESVFVSEQFYAKHMTYTDSIACERKFCVDDKVFAAVSSTDEPQGILAIVNNAKTEIGDIFKSGLRTTQRVDMPSLIIICDGVQDPGNVGTIIRVCDCVGAHGVILANGCCDAYNPKVVRSTMGSVFTVSVCEMEDVLQAISSAKEAGYTVVCGSLEATKSLYDADLSGKVAILVGNEGSGVSQAAACAANLLVKIPIAGSAESLNVAMAAGIMAYEAFRQGGAHLT